MDMSEDQRFPFRQHQDNQRKCPRFEVSYPAIFGDSENGIWVGTVSDISREGCRIRCGGAVPPVRYLKIEICLDGWEDRLKVDLAVMRWLKENDIGIEFICMVPESQARLHLLIRSCEELVLSQEECRLQGASGSSADPSAA